MPIRIDCIEKGECNVDDFFHREICNSYNSVCLLFSLILLTNSIGVCISWVSPMYIQLSGRHIGACTSFDSSHQARLINVS